MEMEDKRVDENLSSMRLVFLADAGRVYANKGSRGSLTVSVCSCLDCIPSRIRMRCVKTHVIDRRCSVRSIHILHF